MLYIVFITLNVIYIYISFVFQASENCTSWSCSHITSVRELKDHASLNLSPPRSLPPIRRLHVGSLSSVSGWLNAHDAFLDLCPSSCQSIKPQSFFFVVVFTKCKSSSDTSNLGSISIDILPQFKSASIFVCFFKCVYMMFEICMCVHFPFFVYLILFSS